MKAKIRIENLDSLIRKAERMTDYEATEAMLEASQDGAEIMLEAQLSGCPVKTGRLKDSHEIREAVKERHQAMLDVGPDPKRAWYWRIVHNGTSGKASKRRKRKPRTVRANPWLSRAFDQTRAESKNAIADRLLEFLERVRRL